MFNKFGKKIKCEAKPRILSLFPNVFNKFNKTRAQMLYSIYHMALRFLKSHFFLKNVINCHYVRNIVMDVIPIPENL